MRVKHRARGVPQGPRPTRWRALPTTIAQALQCAILVPEIRFRQKDQQTGDTASATVATMAIWPIVPSLARSAGRIPLRQALALEHQADACATEATTAARAPARNAHRIPTRQARTPLHVPDACAV